MTPVSGKPVVYVYFDAWWRKFCVIILMNCVYSAIVELWITVNVGDVIDSSLFTIVKSMQPLYLWRVVFWTNNVPFACFGNVIALLAITNTHP